MINKTCQSADPDGFSQSVANAPMPARNAFDIKEMHTALGEFSADELKQIRVLCEGSRLEAGSRYLKLSEHYRQEIQATGNEEVEPHEVYIAKRDIPFELWNRLVGIEEPNRTKQNA